MRFGAAVLVSSLSVVAIGNAKATPGALADISEVTVVVEDLNAASVEAAMKIIAGTARSMGLEVV